MLFVLVILVVLLYLLLNEPTKNTVSIASVLI